mgnify:FL=1
MNRVFLSLGSNIIDELTNLSISIDKIIKHKKINFISKSKIYISSPMYNTNQRDFYNMVIEIETTFLPKKLLNYLKGIEKKMGRETTKKRNLPRIIDIDILSYSDHSILTETLIIPHEKLEERLFVLKPWNDIDPEFLVPKINKKVKQILKNLISCKKKDLIREIA